MEEGESGKVTAEIVYGWSIGRSNDGHVVGDDGREMVAKSRAPIVGGCEEIRDYGTGESDECADHKDAERDGSGWRARDAGAGGNSHRGRRTKKSRRGGSGRRTESRG